MPNRRRLESAALVLPIFGAILLVPPLINIFNIPVRIAGVPLEVIYLFALWLALIGATMFLSWRIGSRLPHAPLKNNTDTPPEAD